MIILSAIIMLPFLSISFVSGSLVTKISECHFIINKPTMWGSDRCLVVKLAYLILYKDFLTWHVDKDLHCHLLPLFINFQFKLVGLVGSPAYVGTQRSFTVQGCINTTLEITNDSMII